MQTTAYLRRDVLLLPRTLKDFKVHFPDLNAEFAPITPQQHIIAKFSGNALRIGRPLDSAMIFMAGESGSGKSSTINALFHDQQLCETNANRSTTKYVANIKKQLQIEAGCPSFEGTLSFVDIPGIFDTDDDDATNLAKIRMFTNKCTELECRPRDHVLVRPTVHPNIILFVVNASDNRMDGSHSCLVKSIKALKAEGLIDYMRNNVIVVLTHSLSMAQNRKRFLEKFYAKTATIQKLFYEHLQIHNVTVVPVENEPKDFDLEEDGDFYKLPNGELSPRNLFFAIIKCLNFNEDTLGNLLISQYLAPNCQEKNLPAILTKYDQSPSIEDVEQAARDLQHIGIGSTLSERGPAYHFQSLGYGFCPVTETVKHMFPFKKFEQLHSVHIENSTFSIPTCIKVHKERASKFHRLTFIGKEEYQNHVKVKYGINLSMGLVAQGKSDGRWIAEDNSTKEDSHLSLLQEVRLAKLSLQNPNQLELNKYFTNDLNNLPEMYEEGQYKAFFLKWGTHFVVEETVGGAIHMNCTVAKGQLKKSVMGNIDADVSGIFDALLGKDDKTRIDYETKVNRLRQMGISKEQLQLEGGILPGFISLENPNFGEIHNWSESVAYNPTELKCSIKLVPYYDLLEYSPKCATLRSATENYLNGGATDNVESTSRQVISDNSVMSIMGASLLVLGALAFRK